MRLLTLLLISVSLWAAPAYVQSASGRDGGGTKAVAFGSNVASGNLLVAVVIIESGSGATVSSVTDTQGNSYSAVAAQINSGTSLGIRVYYTTAGSSAANTVTAVVSSGGVHLGIVEYSGATATVNTSAQASGVNDSSGTSSTGNMVGTSDDALIFVTETNSGAVVLGGAGYTERINEVPDKSLNIADKNGASGTYSGSWTWGGTKQWAAQGVIFGAAAAANPKKRVIVF